MKRLSDISWVSAMIGSVVAQATGLALATLGVVIGLAEDWAVWNWVIAALGFEAVGIGWLIVANMNTLMSRVTRIESKIDDLNKVI